MLEERRLEVLRAIVEDFVSTHEPVGSKALVERHSLGVSPATIRNDMAALEDEGFITQPHTSAGRVPTDRGYRLFVDRLSGVKPLSAAERRAIESFLGEAVDLDDVMQRTVRLLAQATKQVAMVQYPSLSRSRVRHVELVSMSSTRLMIIVVSDSGRVDQRTIDTPEPIEDSFLADMRSRLSVVMIDKPLATLADDLVDFDQNFDARDRAVVALVVAAALETMSDKIDERVVLGGTSHLARYHDAFPLAIQPVLEALEEQVVLLRLLGEMPTDAGVSVRIGAENTVEGLATTSVITARYARTDSAVASLGVVGPTHMDYAGTMGAVHAVAQYVSKILDGQ